MGRPSRATLAIIAFFTAAGMLAATWAITASRLRGQTGGACGNGVIDAGEECGEPGLGCVHGETCAGCACSFEGPVAYVVWEETDNGVSGHAGFAAGGYTVTPTATTLFHVGGADMLYGPSRTDVLASSDALSWTKIGDFPVPIRNHSAVWFQERLLVFGGSAGNPSSPTADAYSSPDGRAWQREPAFDLPVALEFPAVHAWRDRLWLVTTDRTYYHDGAQWVEAEAAQAFTFPVTSRNSVLFDDRIIVIDDFWRMYALTALSSERWAWTIAGERRLTESPRPQWVLPFAHRRRMWFLEAGGRASVSPDLTVWSDLSELPSRRLYSINIQSVFVFQGKLWVEGTRQDPGGQMMEHRSFFASFCLWGDAQCLGRFTSSSSSQSAASSASGGGRTFHVIDDEDSQRFYYGNFGWGGTLWNLVGSNAYRGAHHVPAGGAWAGWKFGSIAPGDYEVYATWLPDPATAWMSYYNVTYQMEWSAERPLWGPAIGVAPPPGMTVAQSVVDQSKAPVGERWDGVPWQKLGDVTVRDASKTLEVFLLSAGSHTVADAVLLVPKGTVWPASSSVSSSSFTSISSSVLSSSIPSSSAPSSSVVSSSRFSSPPSSISSSSLVSSSVSSASQPLFIFSAALNVFHGKLQVAYRKDFEHCAVLLNEQGTFVTNDFQSYFCGNWQNPVKILNVSPQLAAELEGRQIRLCEGPNFVVCSPPVTVTNPSRASVSSSSVSSSSSSFSSSASSSVGGGTPPPRSDYTPPAFDVTP